MSNTIAAIYCRVSTDDQNPEHQVNELKKYCEFNNFSIHRVYVDRVSGSKDSRPELNQLMFDMRQRKFNTVVVYKLDRLGRSLRHLIELMGELEEKGIAFQSLQESIDTSSSGGKLIFHMFGALAEFERNLIQERTKAGLAAARARGRKGGRRKSLSSQKRAVAVEFYNSIFKFFGLDSGGSVVLPVWMDLSFTPRLCISALGWAQDVLSLC